jgi:hypothetical protein
VERDQGRRKPNGRLEVFDEGAISWHSEDMRRLRSFRRRRKQKAAYKANPEIALPQMAKVEHKGLRKILTDRVRMDMLEKAIQEKDLAKAQSIFPESPAMLKFAAVNSFIAGGRTLGSRLARLTCWQWYERPGEHIIDSMQALSKSGDKNRVAAPTAANGVQEQFFRELVKRGEIKFGKGWKFTQRGHRHVSLTRIAKTFGISPQALSQAWRRYRRTYGLPAQHTGRN